MLTLQGRNTLWAATTPNATTSTAITSIQYQSYTKACNTLRPWAHDESSLYQFDHVWHSRPEPISSESRRLATDRSWSHLALDIVTGLVTGHGVRVMIRGRGQVRARAGDTLGQGWQEWEPAPGTIKIGSVIWKHFWLRQELKESQFASVRPSSSSSNSDGQANFVWTSSSHLKVIQLVIIPSEP